MRLIGLLLIVSGFIMLSGCGTLSNGRGHGHDATLTPGWGRIKLAAYNAAVSPYTWAPAVGGAVIMAGGYDEKISKWASENTPVFGSRGNAARASDELLETTHVLSLGTALTSPIGVGIISGSIALASEAGAGALTTATVTDLKNVTGRMRPNGHNNSSFPSSHSSHAALFTTLTARNLEYLNLPKEVMLTSQIGLGALTAATAWARLEADWHYPSDVLAGIAIGHFFGSFIMDTFLGLDSSAAATATIEPLQGGAALEIGLHF